MSIVSTLITDNQKMEAQFIKIREQQKAAVSEAYYF